MSLDPKRRNEDDAREKADVYQDKHAEHAEDEAQEKADAQKIKPDEGDFEGKEPLTGPLRMGMKWGELADKRREKALKRSISETIGRSWFFLAILCVIGFPLLDVLQKAQVLSGEAPLAEPSWATIFMTNAKVGFFISLPVFLAYAVDYFGRRHKGLAWRKAKKKKAAMLSLAVLLVILFILAIVFKTAGI